MTKNKPQKQRKTLNDKAIISILARSNISGLVSVPEAAKVLKKSSLNVASTLAHLEKKGWIKRVKKGTYFILPLEATKREGGIAGDPWVVASVLYKPCYIGGWSAVEHWELTEQLFRSTFVVTSANIRTKEQNILGNDYRIVRVSKEKVEKLSSVWRGSIQINISDRERTLIDGCANPSWVGGFRQLADMLGVYLSSEYRNDAKLLDCAHEAGKGSIYKRLGFLLEKFDPKVKKLIVALKAKITSGIIKLDPMVASKGKLNSTWGVWENISI
ncbi:MAG: hypothetical protein NTV06_06055 [candidate division Zixibacteria bacterium]|nr:hypothetical protein [candidate division Zixibacteria bacterium]